MSKVFSLRCVGKRVKSSIRNEQARQYWSQRELRFLVTYLFLFILAPTKDFHLCLTTVVSGALNTVLRHPVDLASYTAPFFKPTTVKFSKLTYCKNSLINLKGW